MAIKSLLQRRPLAWIRRRWIATTISTVMVLGGLASIGVAVKAQYHAPQPTKSVAGHVNPYKNTYYSQDNVASQASLTHTVGPSMKRSTPISISIPAIDVSSKLQDLGLNSNGTIQVPQPGPNYNEAAWYKYSPTPGQIGPSVIEGHIDSAAEGPSVFFRLGALKPGEHIDITLKDGSVAVFTITAVRQYPKTSFPTSQVYGNTNFAALRLISCSGVFDHSTKQYLSNVVVYAALTSSAGS